MKSILFGSLMLYAVFAFYSVHTAPTFNENVDFELIDHQIVKRSPDYGSHLGGPVAAGIREPKEDSDNSSSSKSNVDDEYKPTSNLGNNTKKCEVVRLRKTPDSNPAAILAKKNVAKAIQRNKAVAVDKASQEFEVFVKKFRKTYPTAEAKEQARENFVKAKNNAHELNQGRCASHDAQFGTTKYSDWSNEDFVVKLAGTREPPPGSNVPKFAITVRQAQFLYSLPSLDWRRYGVVPPVRDQEQCGGCYAFSSSDLLACQERIDRKQYNRSVEPYSAQYLIDCMPAPFAYGCKGGRPLAVLEYLESCPECTILKDRCYQYHSRNLTCKEKPSVNCRQSLGVRPVNSKQVNIDTNRELETMAALLRWGPVVAVVALSPAWQYYNGSGILRANHCDKQSNHAILVVGYDYTGDVPFYWVRNSWSDTWGVNGYVRLEAGRNTCGVANAVLVTCTNEKCKNFDKIDDFVNHPNAVPSLRSDNTRDKP